MPWALGYIVRWTLEMVEGLALGVEMVVWGGEEVAEEEEEGGPLILITLK